MLRMREEEEEEAEATKRTTDSDKLLPLTRPTTPGSPAFSPLASRDNLRLGVIEDEVRSSANTTPSTSPPSPVCDAMAFMALAAQALTQDEFSKCFDSLPRVHAFAHKGRQLLWLIGVGIRYGLLLPFRLLSMFVTMSVFLAYLAWTLCIGGDYQRAFCFGCQAFLWSLGAIVRHHGRKLRHRVPHLYVANHTSYLDFAILSSHEFPLAPLGQIHGGLFGFVQRTLLQTGLGALVFNRDEERDRAIVAQRMREHTQDLRRAPLLVFPEGTCVNNEATVLFHKGAFDLEADVVPVAIKYNKRLFDPYWNTREQAFSQNILYLMTRWLFMVDVWWLPRQCRLPDESAIDFSNRVKALISEAAGLANLGWDGYMKNFMRPAFRDKLLASMQRQYADALLRHALLLQSSLTSKRPKDDGLVRAEREEPTIVKSWWRKRSLSAVMCDELERRSASPLLPPNAATLMATTTVEPWVDIKTSLSNRRWMPKRTTAPQPPSTQSPFPSTLPSNPAPSSQLDASKVSESRDDD